VKTQSEKVPSSPDQKTAPPAPFEKLKFQKEKNRIKTTLLVASN